MIKYYSGSVFGSFVFIKSCQVAFFSLKIFVLLSYNTCKLLPWLFISFLHLNSLTKLVYWPICIYNATLNVLLYFLAHTFFIYINIRFNTCSNKLTILLHVIKFSRLIKIIKWRICHRSLHFNAFDALLKFVFLI